MQTPGLESNSLASSESRVAPRLIRARVLIVDDEEDIVEVISYNLEKDGYLISRAYSGEEALEKVRVDNPDLILLDLMLPGIDGLDVCKELKSNLASKHIPIVMLSAKGDEADVVSSLELGATDYITKPFSQRILSAKIKSVLKRGQLAPEIQDDAAVSLHGISLHAGKHEVRVDGALLELTATEFRLLKLLIGKPGWVFTRDQIVDAVRGEDCAVTSRSVDVQLVGLRKKLGSKAEILETVRGVGYRVKADG